jgi:ATP-binding cassette, subfamily B, bacterial PglK
MLSASKKLYQLLTRKDRVKFVLLFGLMLIGMMLEVIGIGMIPLFISSVADPDLLLNNRYAARLLTFMGIQDSRELLIAGGITLIAVFFVKGAYTIGLNYARSRFVYGRFQSISSALFKTYLFSPYTYHLNRNTADLIRNVTNETTLVSSCVLLPILTILMQSVTTLGIFALLVVVEPVITLITFLVIGCFSGLTLKLLKNRIRIHGEIAVKERSRLIKGVNEGMGGIKYVAVTSRQNYFLNKFNHYLHNLKKAEIFVSISGQAIKPVNEFIAVLGMMIIAFFMIYQGRPLTAVIPVLALFGAAAIKLIPATTQIVSQLNTLRYYSHSLDPVYRDIMDKREMDSAGFLNAGEYETLPFTSEIELRNVVFCYPNTDVQAINGVNLTIKKGEAIGFVGLSGAGKTTIVDVILGLLEPQAGGIFVDGVHITTHKKAWQNNIGYIPQFIFLADDTIRNNIAFGIPEEEISDEKINSAVKAAQLEEFVETLDNGIHTEIGEQGARISGGQRQRIGIARALYNNPDVLIMDEATSALDNITEKYVINAIESLKGTRTIIMIAHRLTTVMNCDRLFLMQNGKIVSKGSYDELLENSSYFREMALED